MSQSRLAYACSIPDRTAVKMATPPRSPTGFRTQGRPLRLVWRWVWWSSGEQRRASKVVCCSGWQISVTLDRIYMCTHAWVCVFVCVRVYAHAVLMMPGSQSCCTAMEQILRALLQLHVWGSAKLLKDWTDQWTALFI